VSVFGPWHFAFWERDMIGRFRRLCVLLAFLIFAWVLAAQSNHLPTHIWEGGRTVFVKAGIVASSVMSA
jgi:hypothetical protein